MLEKILKKPAELTIDNKVIRFSTIDDFEFALFPRTTITFDKISELISTSFDELCRELQSIRRSKDELSKLLSLCPETSSGINIRLTSVDSGVFSKEHSWRNIFIALNSFSMSHSSVYKNTALKMYLRYLSNRMDIIKYIKKESVMKKDSINEKEEHAVTILRAPNSSSLSTLEFDTSPLNSVTKMERIIKGDAVILEIDDGDTVDVQLSRYNCKLLARDGIKFIDSNGVEHSLEIGENKIGRSNECTIIFDQDMREISRVHLLIYNYDHKRLLLTDLSTDGTSLPKALIIK